MEKYIIAVDMDGTLLNSVNKISERTRNVLQRLINEGHYVVPATGRTRELIPQEFSVLHGVKWGIVENGCVVWDYDKNELVWYEAADFVYTPVTEVIYGGNSADFQAVESKNIFKIMLDKIRITRYNQDNKTSIR